MKSASSPIELPAVEYGYRKTPYSWSELSEIIEHTHEYGRLCRSESQQQQYEEHKYLLKQTWKSIADHVLCTKFGLERRQDGGLYHSYPPIEAISEISTVVVRNDFPYCLPEHIEHWVLWKLGGVCSDDDIRSAKVEIQSRNGRDATAFLSWTNPPQYQSLGAIDHAHILCLRDAEGS